jgi:hypothetical protein
MANKKAKKKSAARAAAAPADKATMVVTLYDGTREPIEDQDFLIRIFDGFQNQLFDDFKPAPTTVFSLPFRDNLQDNCIVVATGKGHVDAGFSPVKLSPKAVAMVDLMLLEDDADFKFQTWAALGRNDPVISYRRGRRNALRQPATDETSGIGLTLEFGHGDEGNSTPE